MLRRCESPIAVTVARPAVWPQSHRSPATYSANSTNLRRLATSTSGFGVGFPGARFECRPMTAQVPFSALPARRHPLGRARRNRLAKEGSFVDLVLGRRAKGFRCAIRKARRTRAESLRPQMRFQSWRRSLARLMPVPNTVPTVFKKAVLQADHIQRLQR